MEKDDKILFKGLVCIYVLFLLIGTINAYVISHNRILISKNTTINPENLKPNYPEQIILNKEDIQFLFNLDCKYESFGVSIGCHNAQDKILEHLKLKTNNYASRPSILSQDTNLKICYPNFGGYASINPNNTKIELIQFNTTINYQNITLGFDNTTYSLFNIYGQKSDLVNASKYQEVRIWLK